MAVFGNEAHGSKGFEVVCILNQAFGIEIEDFNSGTVATRDGLVPAQNARAGEMGESAVGKRDGKFDRRIRKKLLRDVDGKAAAAESHMGNAGVGGKGFADATFRSSRGNRVGVRKSSRGAASSAVRRQSGPFSRRAWTSPLRHRDRKRRPALSPQSR